MKWRRVVCVHIATYLFSFIVIALMSVSYWQECDLIWTHGTTKTEIISNSGVLYLVQNRNWWREERFTICYGPATSPSPVDTWIGMRIDRQTQFLGYTHAAGEWISPFVQATPETTFTAPRFVREPGMYYSTTPVEIYAIPHCLFLIVPLTWMIIYYSFRVRQFHRGKQNNKQAVASGT